MTFIRLKGIQKKLWFCLSRRSTTEAEGLEPKGNLPTRAPPLREEMTMLAVCIGFKGMIVISYKIV
jgi:hypothetical protein